MPKRRFAKRRNKKKSRKGGRGGMKVSSQSAGSLARPLRAFAAETFTVLRYAEQITFNPGSATNSTNVFSMNGCYDPNVTGTGHQPYGFDEYCASGGAGPYNRYTVARARMELVVYVPAVENATPGTAEPRGGALVTINARRENTSNFTNAYSNIEDPTNCGWTLINQFQNCKRLRTPWFSVGKYFGLSQTVYDSQIDFSGTYAANPANQAYFLVSVSTPAQTVIDPIDVYAQVLIEYEVKFWSQNASVVSDADKIAQLEDRLAALEVAPKVTPAVAGLPRKATSVVLTTR